MKINRLVAALRDDGFCVIADVIPARECEALRATFFERYRTRRDHIAVGPHVGLFQGVVNDAPALADRVCDERVVAVAEALLHSPVRTSFTTAIINDAGADDGELHADWPYDATHVAHMAPPYPDVAVHLTSLWALDGGDERRGGTAVIRGSHQRASNPTAADCVAPASDREEVVAVPRGGLLLLDSRLWHRRVHNGSDEPRVVVAAGYVPWWLNLEPLRPGAAALRGLWPAPGKKDFRVPLVRPDVFAGLSARAQSFFSHAVDHERASS